MSKKKSGLTAVQSAAGELRPEQAVALEQIIAGATMQTAAEAAGVDRITLYRWRTRDVNFVGALEAWRREQVSSAHDRLSGLAAAATQAVSKQIADGDGRLAMRLLEKMGVVGVPATPPGMLPDAEHVEYKTLYVIRIENCGWKDESVCAFVSELVGCSIEETFPFVYDHQPIRWFKTEQRAHAVLQELKERGAMAVSNSIKVLVDKNLMQQTNRSVDPAGPLGQWDVGRENEPETMEWRKRFREREAIAKAATTVRQVRTE